MSNLREGDRVIYRNSECLVVEVGVTYVCLLDSYTGVKHLLPLKQVSWVSISPAEIKLKEKK